MDLRHPQVAIAVKPEYVTKDITSIFGIKVAKNGVITLTKAQDTLYAKNLRASMGNLWGSFGYHIQKKVIKAFQTESDPSGGKKWKKLSREAIALRGNLQTQYDREFADKGFRGRRKKVQYPQGNVKALQLTGKLLEVASGRRLKGLTGGLGRQRAGNLGKDGIQLTIYAAYRRGGLLQQGAYTWSLDGPKVRHINGFTEYFTNVLSDGTEVERTAYPVPARPYIPKFSNQFMSAWLRANVPKRAQHMIIATKKGYEQIIGDASIRGLNF